MTDDHEIRLRSETAIAEGTAKLNPSDPARAALLLGGLVIEVLLQILAATRGKAKAKTGAP